MAADDDETMPAAVGAAADDEPTSAPAGAMADGETRSAPTADRGDDDSTSAPAGVAKEKARITEQAEQAVAPAGETEATQAAEESAEPPPGPEQQAAAEGAASEEAQTDEKPSEQQKDDDDDSWGNWKRDDKREEGGWGDDWNSSWKKSGKYQGGWKDVKREDEEHDQKSWSTWNSSDNKHTSSGGDEKWKCPACNFFNRQANTVCGGANGKLGCKAPRPGGPRPGGSGEGGGVEREEKWKCPACNFFNRQSNTVCGGVNGKLGCKAPRQQDASGDSWVKKEYDDWDKTPQYERGGSTWPQNDDRSWSKKEDSWSTKDEEADEWKKSGWGDSAAAAAEEEEAPPEEEQHEGDQEAPVEEEAADYNTGFGKGGKGQKGPGGKPAWAGKGNAMSWNDPANMMAQLFQTMAAARGLTLPQGGLPWSPGPQQFAQRPGCTPCSFYMRTGQCRYGLTCRFDHPPRDLAPAVAPAGPAYTEEDMDGEVAAGDDYELDGAYQQPGMDFDEAVDDDDALAVEDADIEGPFVPTGLRGSAGAGVRPHAGAFRPAAWAAHRAQHFGGGGGDGGGGGGDGDGGAAPTIVARARGSIGLEFASQGMPADDEAAAAPEGRGRKRAREPLLVSDWARRQDEFFPGEPALPDGWIRAKVRKCGRTFFVRMTDAFVTLDEAVCFAPLP
eukprot:TRINITY_DN30442_c0_g2_i1.p1 TRINITY_DN30442_c0_g2~~TRINITY_DN30442_c0_g2_i1.p1  ORF type:complete len:672 (+),score=197.40 TRINITY_DN30442_c0_g2_i1:63-2078(+)